jgi:phosphoglycerol transferase MdoB-like AlkP superfamily enzyme
MPFVPLPPMMRRLPFSLLPELVFWLLVFVFFRVVFLLFHGADAQQAGPGEFLGILPSALKLDISMASYFLGLSFLVRTAGQFVLTAKVQLILRNITTLFFFIYALMALAEIEIYREWGTKLNARAFAFLNDPSEVFRSARTGFLVSALISIMVGTWLCRKYILNRMGFAQNREKPTRAILLSLVSAALIFTGIRGGFSPIPVQVSDAFYSRHQVLNLASANTAWNFIHSISENKKAGSKNPFVFMNDERADALVDSLLASPPPPPVHFLKANKPNIVLVILEGWSADLIEGKDAFSNLTPVFNRLLKSGYYFDSVFASGNLSDQGITSILAAYPSQPLVSITSQPDKTKKIPSLAKVLSGEGYQSQFMFGGQLSYGNIKSFILGAGFDRIYEGSDFPGSFKHGKLGVHDADLLEFFSAKTGELNPPFFSVVFTGSSHSPYDHPGPKNKFNFGSDEDAYANAVHYSDFCLGQFLASASRETWFEKSLFVFIADHSHKIPGGMERNHPGYRRIPLLFWGPALHPGKKGLKDSGLGSQTDLAPTLLHILNLDENPFTWGNSLLNPGRNPFAYFENTDGFGWIWPKGYYVWGPDKQGFHFTKGEEDPGFPTQVENGKAFLQKLFKDYLEK